jgi:branched-chain amino acid transport system permease protein
MVSIAVVNLLLPGGLCLIPFIMGEFFAYQLGLYLLYGVAAQGIGLTRGRVDVRRRAKDPRLCTGVAGTD